MRVSKMEGDEGLHTCRVINFGRELRGVVTNHLGIDLGFFGLGLGFGLLLWLGLGRNGSYTGNDCLCDHLLEAQLLQPWSAVGLLKLPAQNGRPASIQEKKAHTFDTIGRHPVQLGHRLQHLVLADHQCSLKFLARQSGGAS
jgi:hypothetical protein